MEPQEEIEWGSDVGAESLIQIEKTRTPIISLPLQ